MNRLVAALVIGLVILAGCTAQPAPTQTPMPEATPEPTAPPSASPTAEPEPTPEPAPTASWQPATVPAPPMGSATLAVVPGGDGLVAIAVSSGGTLVWTSADGLAWRDVTPAGFERVGMVAAIEYEGGIIGVGRADIHDPESELAAVFLSDDGLTWRMADGGPEMRGQMIDVVAAELGLFAIGGVPGEDAAGVWRSDDGGETWRRVGGDFPHAYLWTVAEGGPGLVAAGWRRNPEPDLAVWTSADGETWALAPDPEEGAGFEGVGIATAADGTLVMAGRNVFEDGARIWTSDDGLAWSPADLPDDLATGWLDGIAATPDGLIAAGSIGMDAAAWISTDAGRSWSSLGEPMTGAWFTGAAWTDAGGLLFTGGTQTGTLETGIDARAAIWLASLTD